MQLKNVCHSFDPRGIAGVHHINLKIKEGEILSLIGASGAGKTTLLRLLSGEITPMQGEIMDVGRVSYMGMGLSTQFQGSLQDWLVSAITKNINEEQKIQWARDLADVLEFPMQLKKELMMCVKPSL
jgi:ABC-type nitrate/sulfonate/bicarbonate transport system ATPase subunit